LKRKKIIIAGTLATSLVASIILIPILYVVYLAIVQLSENQDILYIVGGKANVCYTAPPVLRKVESISPVNIPSSCFIALSGIIFQEGKASDDDFNKLETFRSLTEIWLEMSPISEKGLTSISKIPNLNYLSLKGCPISDELLKILYRSKHLSEINLIDTKVTEDGIIDFQKELPKCAVTTNGKRYPGADEIVPPLNYKGEFHKAIEKADLVVVRDGGFNCCKSADGDKILFKTSDPKEIKDLYDHISFSGKQNACLCCGHPGIDWYKGKKRLALTSMQHGRALRWSGFKNFGLNYADAYFTEDSEKWLCAWFEKHGVQLREEQGGTVNTYSQTPEKSKDAE